MSAIGTVDVRSLKSQPRHSWLSWLTPALSGFVLALICAKVFLAAMGPQPPARAAHTVAASILLNLLGLAWLLALFPHAGATGLRPSADPCPTDNESPGSRHGSADGRRPVAPMSHLAAWLRVSVAFAAALLGLALAGGHQEDFRTFFALGAIFAAQAALVCALNALLSAWLYPRVGVARQLTMLVLTLLATAMFWSRGPILSLRNEAALSGFRIGDRLADGVVKLSPPLAVVGTWYQESTLARNARGQDDVRYNVFQGPLSYHVWLGTYLIVPYPQILPKTERMELKRRFVPGIVLVLAAWGIPLMLLGDFLLRRRAANIT